MLKEALLLEKINLFFQQIFFSFVTDFITEVSLKSYLINKHWIYLNFKFEKKIN